MLKKMNMFSSTMALIVATLLSSTMGQQITVPGETALGVVIPYQILPLSVKMTVSDKGFEIESFQSRFEGIMALHLTNHFLKSLPAIPVAFDKPLIKDIFDKVELRTRLAKTYTGAPGGESRIEAAISGAAYFNFAVASDAPAGNATYTRQVMTTTTLEAFQGPEYLKMLDLYLEDDILREVTGMEISVENTLIAGGGFYNPVRQGGSSSSNPNTAAIAASVVCLALAAVGVILVYLVQKKKRKQSGKSLRIGEGDPQPLEQSVQAGAEEGTDTKSGDISGDNSSDIWMDEWTQKITSIPLRLAGKTAKAKPHSRPATRQSRKVWLFCKYRRIIAVS
jgi:hypothetical protein